MRTRTAMMMAIGILVAVSGLVHAQSGGDPSATLGAGYDLTWYTVDNGGITLSTGDGYQLGGTIGQPDAGVLSGGVYALAGGFLEGGPVSKPPAHHIYLPLVLR